MTRREAVIVLLFLAFPVFVIGLLALLALIIAVLPRDDTREVRRRLAGFVMRQWEVGSNLSSILYSWLWQKGNGH